jgi:hypothetical protein
MNYIPPKGFFDISTCPKTLDKQTHLKMQNIQMFLATIQISATYYKTHEKLQWQKAKEMSAELQQVIFQHWSHEELFGVDIVEYVPEQMVMGF